MKRRKKKSVPAVVERDAPSFASSNDTTDIDPRILVASSDENPLGGASADGIRKVVSEELGADPDLATSETGIAVDTLARVLAARSANSSCLSDPKQLAVFVITDRPRDLANRLSAVREPIIDNGSKCLTGRVWIVSPNMASGYYFCFGTEDSAGAFNEIESRGLGSMSALVFDPTATEPEIRYYPRGLRQEDHVQRFMISAGQFSFDTLDTILKRVRDDNLITPDAAVREFDPWINGTKYIPRKNVEAFVQAILKLALSVAFGPQVKVDFERRGNEGRCDLLISSRHTTQSHGWLCNAALELKVIRSLTSGGTPVSSTTRAKAIADGLKQAIAYKRENSAEHGMLCCYDMRLPKHVDGLACFDPIASRAKRAQIHLRRYRLYGSSADLRNDKYGADSTAREN